MKLPKFTTLIPGQARWSTKQLIIGAVIVLVLFSIGIYLYWEYKKKKQAVQASQTGEAPVIPLIPDNAPAVPLFSDCPNDSFPLKFGKCGKRVEQFQMYLVREYGAKFSTYGVDGKWGDETELLANKFIIKNAPFTISEDYFNKTGMGAYKTLKYA
jgi:hypothetical protein